MYKKDTWLYTNQNLVWIAYGVKTYDLCYTKTKYFFSMKDLSDIFFWGHKVKEHGLCCENIYKCYW